MSRLSLNSSCQPPATWCALAILDRVSPATTLYSPSPFLTTVAVVVDGVREEAAAEESPLLDEELLDVLGVDELLLDDDEPPVPMSGDGPPAVRPPADAQDQAPGPCMESSTSATAICWSLVARSARAAYFRPPAASQLDWENCRPP